MKADFDKAAANYDAVFTNSVIGKLQRSLVYEHLSKILKSKPNQEILEINCGTGEDAVWMANKNHHVMATDISKEMLTRAKDKADLPNLTYKQVDLTKLSAVFPDQKFDLIFSNFGGLNCLSKIQLEDFFRSSSEIIAPNGKLVLIIMPKNTLWEQSYFLWKRNFKNVFRRKKEVAIADVNGEKVTTYYYNPKDIVHLSKSYFEISACKPIGFFAPPSYLESFFKDKPKLISLLNNLEQKIKNQSWLSKYADHYLIVVEKK